MREADSGVGRLKMPIEMSGQVEREREIHSSYPFPCVPTHMEKASIGRDQRKREVGCNLHTLFRGSGLNRMLIHHT